MGETLDEKKIELMGVQYIVYLKEVPTKIFPGGMPEKTTIRAFIKKE
jgi:hypothetical protein